MSLLALEQLQVSYGGIRAVKGVDLTVEPGELVCLIGANGAGKTTTLRVASGLVRPRQGNVMLEGAEVSRLGPYRRVARGLCHIPEGRGIFPSLTVRENLILDSARGKEREAIEKAVETFPVLGVRQRQVAGTLSGGEQQMLALVRAYVSKPKIVLVDEASLGLAPLVVDSIFAFLERLAEDGVALLIVEQYVSRAIELASTVYLLSQGSIVYSGPAGELDEDAIFALYAGHEAGAAL
jgi:branched-chain amino acid transport system ATP-binding protein